MKRRNFLKSTSALAAAALTAQIARPLMAIPSNSRFIDNIGLQLWTVRNQLEKDNESTLKAIADAGYKQVELMDVGQAKDLLPICKDVGLDVTSAFINWESICDPKKKDVPKIDEIIEDAQKAGLEHLVFGYVGKGHREKTYQYKNMAEAANEMGSKCREAKIQLCYHNHSFEFEKLGPKPKADSEGKTPKDQRVTGFDIFIQRFDPVLVKFELDVFWAQLGGWDPLETLQRLNGRVSQVHLKDLAKDSEVIFDEGKVPHESFKELGNGVIDMADVLRVSEEIGVEQCHVEQDQSEDPLKSIATSIKHLKTL